MYGAPYDRSPSRWACVRTGCAASSPRWRRVGLVQTGRRRGAGLPAPGLAAIGLRNALARLAHIRAVLGIGLSLEASDAYRDGQAPRRV
jgi:hypothetical protein